MPDFTRDRARILRCPADGMGMAPGSTPPSVAEDYDIDSATAIAQSPSPPVPNVQAPTNCPPGTTPLAAGMSFGVGVTTPLGGISLGGGATATGCAPASAPATTPAPSPPGGAAPRSDSGPPSSDYGS